MLVLRCKDAVRSTLAALLIVTLPFLPAKPAEPEREIQLIKSRSDRERFEAEFGIQAHDQQALTAPIAHAKYTVDLALFSLENALDDIEAAMELRYSRGRIHRASAMPAIPAAQSKRALFTLEDARLKFDIKVSGGKPHLTVRLVIPFGD